MDIERSCLELLLRKVRFIDIELYKNTDKLSFCRAGKDYFLKIAGAYMSNYTKDELYQIWVWLTDQLNDGKPEQKSQGIFRYIYKMAAHFLEMRNGSFLIRMYDEQGGSTVRTENLQLLRWRELSVDLGNEIFMAALLAESGYKKEQLSEYLCTPFPTFTQEWKEKLSMLHIAENHFHLKGSIPAFLLNWVCLMNHIGEQKCGIFKKLDDYLEPELIYGELEEKHHGLQDISRRAAYYRMYLYLRLNGLQYFLNSPIYRHLDYMEENLSDLQGQINICRDLQKVITKDGGSFECLDYAIGDQWEYCASRAEAAVAGERYFLYRCFCAVFQDDFTYEEKNLFYRYLVISLRVRAELVQVNRRRGFSNFADYQDRKEDVIDEYPLYKKQLINLTVASLSHIQSLSSMELRITPKGQDQTLDQIRQYDLDAAKEEFRNYYFVLHYPKEKDKEFQILKPRNYTIRERLKRQIEEACGLLNRERMDYLYYNREPRVRGFDTCSGEIGCGPEVFAQFYRRLRAYHRRYGGEGLKQVHFTYHAGEDYLDLVSGIRAVDEAVRYCALPPGSRIGHGMALGIDAGSYYRLKKNRSVIPKQEILDNTGWILGFCREQGIVIEKELKRELINTFTRYCREIYGRCAVYCTETDPAEIYEAVREAAAAGEETKGGLSREDDRIEAASIARLEAAAAYITEDADPGRTEIMEEQDRISDYYNGWKLRGDEPELYLNLNPVPEGELLARCSYGEGEALDEIRRNERSRQFYQAYHYDSNVRTEGSKADIWITDYRYYGLISRIQEELRRILTEKRISIECNPSSNYCIGPFGRYEEHPMLRMYGKNLVNDASSRMNISINTDDQGIFYTSLEMEYAVMYSALLKSRDAQNMPRYREEDILKWLEDINIFGNSQTFRYQ